MRSWALVCAILLALSGMAAGALAEADAPEAITPAPEDHAPDLTALAVASDAEEVTVAASDSHQEAVWTAPAASEESELDATERNDTAEPEAPSVEETGELGEERAPEEAAHETFEAPAEAAIEEAGIEEASESAGDESSDATDEVDSTEASELTDDDSTEAPELTDDAEEEEAPSEAPEREYTPRYEQTSQPQRAPDTMSFYGWEYSDAWSPENEMDNSGIVSALDRTSINAHPDADSRVLTWVSRGTELKYLNVTEYDAEGTAWYQVYWDGWTGWVSARHTRLWWPTYY